MHERLVHDRPPEDRLGSRDSYVFRVLELQPPLPLPLRAPTLQGCELEHNASGRWGLWIIYINKGIQTASARITYHLGRDRQPNVKIGCEVGDE